MTRHRYDPQCPDCIPAVVNMNTGELLAKDSPTMAQVLKVWNTLPFAHREAFINVTAFGGEDATDWALAEQVFQKLVPALGGPEEVVS